MRSLFQDFRRSNMDGHIYACKMHDIVHDFAQFLKKNRSSGRGDAGSKKTTCPSCNPLLVSHVKEYRRLLCEEEPPPHLCDCLTSLRVLRLKKCGVVSIPQEIEKMIHLRWLDLSRNKFAREDFKTICKLYYLQFLWLNSCGLKEIPMEIGNLIHLRHLDLSGNDSLKELPESICGLHELRNLDVDKCSNLCGLPEGIHRLINLKHLHNQYTLRLVQFPQGLAQLTGLCTLSEFHGGTGWCKLGWLKNLNQLSGSLKLIIRLPNESEEVVEDAREAELRKKLHIQKLEISFQDEMDKKNESVRMDAMDALQPHPNLRYLLIQNYRGFKLPGWITTSLNQLRHINLTYFDHLSSLPPLGKLPYLEEISMDIMNGLQFVGRELLGITTPTAARDMNIESSSSSESESAATNSTIAFPKLKKLEFYNCPKWREWEDITAEEEESAAVSLMPCLTKLSVINCPSLTALPHRLLRKAWSLEVLHIYGSFQLEQRYGNKDGYPFSE